MKRFLNILLFLFIYTNAGAAVFESGNYNISSFVGESNIINFGATINPESGTSISITAPMTIQNDGVIDGNLDTNDYNVHIRNSGNINGNIIVYHDYTVTQIIQSESDIQVLPITGNYNFTVNVENFSTGANLNSLQNLNAGKYVIKNSSIIINDFADWQNWTADVSLPSDTVTTLVITDSSNVTSGTVLKHVTDPLNVIIRMTDMDGLYTVDLTGYNDVIMNIVRETNYEHIFNGNLGRFVESLKNSESDKDLMSLLNRANTMSGLHNVMNLSYKFNPSILMRPVKAIHNFSLMNIAYNDTYSGVGIKPYYIFSDNTNSFGTRLYLGTKEDDMSFVIGLNFNKFEYDNQFNDFGGFVYGGDIKIKKDFDNFWVNGLAGLSLIKFKTESMYVDGDIKSNPIGHYFYTTIDAGYDYRIFDGLMISPMAGISFQKYGVVNFSDNDTDLHVGANTQYSFVMDGIRYEYAVFGAVNTNADLFGSLRVGFVSVSDGAGASIDLDLFKDEDACHYRTSINARVVF